jgi:hypothetical protein
VLQTSGLFYSIIDRATKEGIDQSIIRFLSRFREIKLSTLDQLSSRILAQLDTNHIELSLYQTLKALAKPSDEIIKQAKALVKSQLAIDVVTSRVTAKTIMQYAQIHRETLLKPSLLIDDVEEYVDPQFSRELVDLALHEFLSAKSLSYHQQPIEDRKAVTRALIERIRNQREFDEPIVRTRLQMMKREREKERTSKRLQRGLDEEEEVKLRAIRNVLEAMIEEKEDELQQIDWSDAKYAKMLQERVSELERFYHTENDRLDAFDVFISVMNIIKHKNIQLSKKYLGYRK